MSRKNPLKGRSAKTNRNKIQKLKNTYRKLFKNSKKQKELHMTLPEKQKPKKKYFYDNYPNEKSFISKFKIKEVNVNK